MNDESVYLPDLLVGVAVIFLIIAVGWALCSGMAAIDARIDAIHYNGPAVITYDNGKTLINKLPYGKITYVYNNGEYIGESDQYHLYYKSDDYLTNLSLYTRETITHTDPERPWSKSQTYELKPLEYVMR